MRHLHYCPYVTPPCVGVKPEQNLGLLAQHRPHFGACPQLWPVWLALQPQLQDLWLLAVEQCWQRLPRLALLVLMLNLQVTFHLTTAQSVTWYQPMTVTPNLFCQLSACRCESLPTGPKIISTIISM